MKFKDPVFEGRFLRRYKRFFADFELDGRVETAHVANTGSLRGLIETEKPCLVTFNDSPTRKLKYSLQALQAPESWVGVNTALANTLVKEAFEQQRIDHWAHYKNLQAEIKISKETRLDFKLSLGPGADLFVEVKNVTWGEHGTAFFPDAVTSRGAKHLEELIELKKQGHDAEMVFVVQRTDCKIFRPAQELDKKYAAGLRAAHSAGVRISVFQVKFEKDGISLDGDTKIAIEL